MRPMKLENSFDVAAPAPVAWRFLVDPERVIPCMPGAELTGVVDERTCPGSAGVKLGPVSLVYKGRVSIEERDDEAMRIVLVGKGTESKGKGTAGATIVLEVSGDDRTTHADITTDLKISGMAASLGRGMIAGVAGKLTRQFAENMERQLAEEEPSAG